MFTTSTQRKYWTFHEQAELEQLREEVNHQYVSKNGGGDLDADDPLRREFFLSPCEETTIRRYYEDRLLDFCREFNPPMPLYVMGTSVTFYKRFYLHNSVMDYHPKDIIYPCVYLACKVEEFNVTITNFVTNMPQFDQQEAVDLVLSQELLLMQMLYYHLTIHNPYRPVEGLLIDIKARTDISDPECLRNGVNDFISKSFHTDACLLFSPAQMALAALLVSGNVVGINLDKYVANKLLETGDRNQLMKLIEQVQVIRQLVKRMKPSNMDEVAALEEKLERCRTQENNPLSELYRQRMDELLDDDDFHRSEKRLRMTEENAMEEEDAFVLKTVE